MGDTDQTQEFNLVQHRAIFPALIRCFRNEHVRRRSPCSRFQPVTFFRFGCRSWLHPLVPIPSHRLLVLLWSLLPVPAADGRASLRPGHLMPLGGGRESPVLRDPEQIALCCSGVCCLEPLVGHPQWKEQSPRLGQLEGLHTASLFLTIWKVLGILSSLGGS